MIIEHVTAHIRNPYDLPFCGAEEKDPLFKAPPLADCKACVHAFYENPYLGSIHLLRNGNLECGATISRVAGAFTKEATHASCTSCKRVAYDRAQKEAAMSNRRPVRHLVYKNRQVCDPSVEIRPFIEPRGFEDPYPHTVYWNRTTCPKCRQSDIFCLAEMDAISRYEEMS